MKRKERGEREGEERKGREMEGDNFFYLFRREMEGRQTKCER